MPIELRSPPRSLPQRGKAFSRKIVHAVLHDWHTQAMVVLIAVGTPYAFKAIGEANSMAEAINASYDDAVHAALCPTKPGLPVGAMALVKPGVFRDIPGRGDMAHGPLRLTIEQNGVTIEEEGKFLRMRPLPDCHPK